MNNNHYVSHLAELNKHNKVSVKENILNQKGVLVAAAGTAIDTETAQKIAKHKLMKPIEQSVAIAYSLSRSKIATIYTERLKEKGLFEESRKNGLYDAALQLLPLLTRYSLVQDKLTIFASVYPDRFGRLLTTGILASSIAIEMGMSHERAGSVFLANMISDVGLLHLEPQIVENEDNLSRKNSRLFQGHVAVSTHFADMVPGLPAIVKRAVLEHHERADGFGYPFGKSLQKLCPEGQILSISEKLTKFHSKLISEKPFSLRTIFAVLRVPTSAHMPDVHNALLRVMRKGDLPYKAAFSVDELKGVVEKSFEKLARLNLWFDMYSNIYEQHKEKLQDSGKFKPWALLHQVKYNIDETGVLSNAQKDWLLSINQELSLEHAPEIEEFYLLLGEVEEQCFFVLRKLFEQKEEIDALFGGSELPEIYYTGLRSILTTEQN